MPYIQNRYREYYDQKVELLCNELDRNGFNAGHINYVITRLLLYYWNINKKYSTMCVLTGILENVKQELYRRHFSGYEELKRRSEGDVI